MAIKKQLSKELSDVSDKVDLVSGQVKALQAMEAELSALKG